MKRREVIGLLKKIIAEQLIQLFLVVLEHKAPNNYQLYVEGNHNFQKVGEVSKNRFTLEESGGYLVF
jgi:hypothetical protein